MEIYIYIYIIYIYVYVDMYMQIYICIHTNQFLNVHLVRTSRMHKYTYLPLLTYYQKNKYTNIFRNALNDLRPKEQIHKYI